MFSPMCSRLLFFITITPHLRVLVESDWGCEEGTAHACCWYFVEEYPFASRTLICDKAPNWGTRSCQGQEFPQCCPVDEVCLPSFLSLSPSFFAQAFLQIRSGRKIRIRGILIKSEKTTLLAVGKPNSD